MNKKKLYLILAIYSLGSLGSNCPNQKTGQNKGFYFDTTDQEKPLEELIKYDLEVLKNFQFKTFDPELLPLFEFDFKKHPDFKLTPDSSGLFAIFLLENWLYERVKIITTQDGNTKVNAENFYKYPNHDFPVFVFLERINRRVLSREPSPSDFYKKILTKESGIFLFKNSGSWYYLYGKKNQKRVSLQLRNSSMVDISSPRVGVVFVDPDLTSVDLSNGNLKSEANSILRLSSLFHEARHSDGNKKSLAFHHTNCPMDNDYRGMDVCDISLNGGYGVQTALLKTLYDNCKKCSPAEIEMLKLLALDLYSKILHLPPKNETDYFNFMQLAEKADLVLNHKMSDFYLNELKAEFKSNPPDPASMFAYTQKFSKSDAELFDEWLKKDPNNKNRYLEKHHALYSEEVLLYDEKIQSLLSNDKTIGILWDTASERIE